MSQLRELVQGDGNLDTTLRALALTVFAAVALALILTTVSVRRGADAGPFQTAHERVETLKEQKASALYKEHMQ